MCRVATTPAAPAASKKVITTDSVAVVALWAMFDQGKVTTLEIKNYLRSKGYNCTQEEVRTELAKYAETFEKYGRSIQLNGKNHTISSRTVGTGVSAHKEYYFNEIKGSASVIAPTAKAAPKAAAKVVTKQDAINAAKKLIASYPRLNSSAISARLAARGITISEASVRAIKSNLNR